MDAARETTGNRSARPRYALLDTARGVALFLMFIYHFSWDLTFYRLADFQIFTDPKWIWFAKFIAGIILFVMGVTQVMARRRGFAPGQVLRRLVLIGGAAALVSGATFMVDPRTYIFFGILHHVTVASLILLVIGRWPSWSLLLMAVFCLIAPNFLSRDFFNADLLHWLGLYTVAPVSVDYVPLFPWFSIPLAGVLAGRWMFRSGDVPLYLYWVPGNPVTRLVHLTGRHSLLVYLIHQPVLFGGLYLFVWLRG